MSAESEDGDMEPVFDDHYPGGKNNRQNDDGTKSRGFVGEGTLTAEFREYLTGSNSALDITAEYDYGEFDFTPNGKSWIWEARFDGVVPVEYDDPDDE